jgi:hypothetical protein
MGEVLRDARLVHKQSAGSKHALDLTQRGEPSFHAAADVIARSEVDHDVETIVVEWKIANVGDVQRGARLRATHSQFRRADQRRIDVDAHELDRRESLAEHR